MFYCDVAKFVELISPVSGTNILQFTKLYKYSTKTVACLKKSQITLIYILFDKIVSGNSMQLLNVRY